MTQETLKATHEGVLTLGNVDIDVAVLNNGQRIITQSGVFYALDRPVRGNSRIDQIPTFMDAKNLQPFINEELMAMTKKVVFLGLNNKKQEGYDAKILPLVSDLYLQAREHKALISSQLETAIKCEILVRSLAKLGITALVDEATGYQYDREKDELQKILKAYIAEELLPWQKRFPDVYYKELFRLNGWDFTINGIKKRPGVIGKWTNTLIYNELPKGVLDELKRKTPKSETGNYSARFHQSLTLDIGEPTLTAQVNQMIMLFKLSDNMSHMWNQFNKLKQRQDGQMEIPFHFDKKGHTIEPIEESILSDFNKSLKKAIYFNPKE